MSNLIKMVMITYNEAIDDEVMEAVAGCGVSSYTKLTKVFGKGDISGTHLGNDVWPGLNNILYAACGEDKAKELVSRIGRLRKDLSKEGIKAFMMPVEEMT
ncbi:MAG: hypothetical protein JXB40_02890 [Candidatus Omnitrophica bacterium]|nr:hypothetical protein [Candidatus Omnitrophota bacterium]